MREKSLRFPDCQVIYDPSWRGIVLPFPVDWKVRMQKPSIGDAILMISWETVDGRVITTVDEAAVRKAAEEIEAAGITNVAVIGVYAPIDSIFRQEEAARDILRAVLGPKANITISRDVAGLGFIERENAAILNATILPLAQRIIRQFQRSLATLGISASL